MDPTSLFQTWGAQLGAVGVLMFVVWKIYHDMKSDKKALVSKVGQLETKHDTFVERTAERTLKALEDNVSTRHHLTTAINNLNDTCMDLSGHVERLPCNLDQSTQRQWRTPKPESPT